MAKQDDGKPTGRARMVAGSLILAVVLVIITADAFGVAETPAQVYFLMVLVGVFWFSVRLPTWGNKE